MKKNLSYHIQSYNVVKLVFAFNPTTVHGDQLQILASALVKGNDWGNRPTCFDSVGNQSTQFLRQARGERGHSFCEATMLVAAPTCCDLHAVKKISVKLHVFPIKRAAVV